MEDGMRRYGMALHDTEEYEGHLLHQAAIFDSLSLLEDLLSGEAVHNINACDPLHRTALYICVTRNSLNCAKLLLDHGADCNIKAGEQCDYTSPLHVAVLDDKHAFVTLLIKHGADIQVEDTHNNTALDLARKYKAQKSVKILEKEAELRHKRKSDWKYCFREACMSGLLLEVDNMSKHLSDVQIEEAINQTENAERVTLLYRCAEAGHADIVRFLMRNNAVATEVHLSTGYSALHIACLNGHIKTATFIIKYCPDLLMIPTIEATLPLHMIAMEGHTPLLEMLMKHVYPEKYLHTYRETGSDRLYKLSFPINARDSKGQSALHIACDRGHIDIVTLLLKFKVKLFRRTSMIDIGDGTSHRKSDAFTTQPPENSTDIELFCPVDLDALDLDGNTPLHLAVKSGQRCSPAHIDIARTLLACGADVNKPLISPSGNSTALIEASQLADSHMCDLLLQHKAADPQHKVLSASLLSHDYHIVASLLNYHSYIDSEYKINRLALYQSMFDSEYKMCESTASMSTLTSGALNTAVVVNWYNLHLPFIKMEWLLSCSQHHNCSISTSTSLQGLSISSIALYAITRIDVSHNYLLTLPSALFGLKSLRLLNVSHNKLTELCSSACESRDSLQSSTDSINDATSETSSSVFADQIACPLIDIQLDHNRMRTIPSWLFILPSLQKLSVTHNRLASLPISLWSAPALTDLNVSHNLLSNLPVYSDIHDTEQTPSPIPELTPGGDSRENVAQVDNTPPGGEVTENPVCTAEVFSLQGVHHHNHWGEKLQVIQHDSNSDESNSTRHHCQLRDLNISHNQLTCVPPMIACVCYCLQKLNLSHNRLHYVSPPCLYPISLTALDLSNNELQALTHYDMNESDDGTLVSERCADYQCYNAQQPSHIYNKSSTTSSSASPHSIKSSTSSHLTPDPLTATLSGSTPPTFEHPMCPHKSHKQLPQLRHLDLSNNKLTYLTLLYTSPGRLPGESENAQHNSQSSSSRHQATVSATYLLYPGLHYLDVSRNHLTSLSPECSQLSQITELKLNYNKINELPSDLGVLTKLWNLDLTGCPVTKSLQSILGPKSRKTSAILGYLKSIKEEATLYNRMKLMFVGVQGIGKTSLLNELRKHGKTTIQNKNWAQRMGHSNMKDRDLKGDTLSTVGVDICDLVLQRAGREVIFRTWDFGGQKEYYATHQYFISKRSLYLVVWKVTDGEKAINEIHQWLVNIQARAPNSPVIIVGTHLDKVTKNITSNKLLYLQNLIETRYMKQREPDKCGLPRVLAHIEVACRSQTWKYKNNNIAELIRKILEVAFSEVLPGSRDIHLLEQKVPASYVKLQDVIRHIAEERKQENKSPVLSTTQYRLLVLDMMERRHQTSFKDIAMLNQATQFLHENGMLLHYDDVNLQDLYFLDPQWLCDILANIVTIREINSLAKSGIMKTDDLSILFKNFSLYREDVQSYIINLLSKFEVALLWDSEHLLIPSLLPTEEMIHSNMYNSFVKIPLLNPNSPGLFLCTTIPDRDLIPLSGAPHVEGHSTFYLQSQIYQKQNGMRSSPTHTSPHPNSPQRSSPQTLKGEIVQECWKLKEKALLNKESCAETGEALRSKKCTIHEFCTQEYTIMSENNPSVSIVRLYMMSYFPSGFWPRFITRLLADHTLYNIVHKIYDFPEEIKQCVRFQNTPVPEPQWTCWQSGIELKHRGLTMCRVKECLDDNSEMFVDYRKCNLVMRMEDDPQWKSLDMSSTSVLEILIPNQTLLVNKYPDNDEIMDLHGIYRTGSNMPDPGMPETEIATECKESTGTTPSSSEGTGSGDTKTAGGAMYRRNNGYPLIDRQASEDAPLSGCGDLTGSMTGSTCMTSSTCSSLNGTSSPRVKSCLTSQLENSDKQIKEKIRRRDQEDRVVRIIPNGQATVTLLSKIIDHIDMLLEDWYPDIGIRFVQNSLGMYLITRVVPCVRCLVQQLNLQNLESLHKINQMEADTKSDEEWAVLESPHIKQMRCSDPIDIQRNSSLKSSLARSFGDRVSANVTLRVGSAPVHTHNRGLTCVEIFPDGDIDSPDPQDISTYPVSPGSPVSTPPAAPVPPPPHIEVYSDDPMTPITQSSPVYCYMIEQCQQAAQQNRVIFCKNHGNMGPWFVASDTGYIVSGHMAPDTVFQDIGDEYLVSSDNIERGAFLGKGAFGAVFSGTIVHQRSGDHVEVAMKMLQPVNPGPKAGATLLQQYQMEKQRWDKDPMKSACEAYLSARKELSILLTLKHDNIVPLIGLTFHPLSLILSLAPLGALNNMLKEYKRVAARLSGITITNVIIQVASALDYLHTRQIIYRDLKSENVLVWKLPGPGHRHDIDQSGSGVEVKLADYGVSRTVLPSGAKGFAGTPPFIAPEIIQHSGEEAYTEKVDCFSFGMFIYELIALRMPFEDEENGGAEVINLRGHVLSGGRPSLTSKDLVYCSPLLDLMTQLWSQDPLQRPSAQQILSIAQSQHFSHLSDVISIDDVVHVIDVDTLHIQEEDLIDLYNDDVERDEIVEMWMLVKSHHCVQLRVYKYHNLHCIHTYVLPLEGSYTYLCCVGMCVWVASQDNTIYIYSVQDYSCDVSFQLECDRHATVQSMYFSQSQDIVYVALTTGHVILCNASYHSSVMESKAIRDRIRTSDKSVLCMTVIYLLGRYELWCGHSGDQISVCKMSDTRVTQKLSHHINYGVTQNKKDVNVADIVTSPTIERKVWTRVSPGSCVYQWDVSLRSITGKLDIAQCISKHFNASITVDVTSIISQQNTLYIGTTTGHLFVADGFSMTVLSVLNSHPKNSIVPMATLTVSDNTNLDPEGRKLGVVTLGRGYYDVLGTHLGLEGLHNKNAQLYAITWHSEHWRYTAKKKAKQK